MIALVMDPAELRVALYNGLKTGELKHDQSVFLFRPQDYLDFAPIPAEEAKCGTTACLAGWSMVLAAPQRALVSSNYIKLDDEQEQVVAYAQRALGIGWDSAKWLFFCTDNQQSMVALQWLAEHPAAGELPLDDDEWAVDYVQILDDLNHSS